MKNFKLTMSKIVDALNEHMKEKCSCYDSSLQFDEFYTITFSFDNYKYRICLSEHTLAHTPIDVIVLKCLDRFKSEVLSIYFT